jgi:hypothetical protein
VLHARAAENALATEGVDSSGRVGQALGTIAELTRSVQGEIRSLIFELRRDQVHGGLVAALARQAEGSGSADGPTIDVRGPRGPLTVSEQVETQLFASARGALECPEACRGQRGAVQTRLRQGEVVLEVRDKTSALIGRSSRPLRPGRRCRLGPEDRERRRRTIVRVTTARMGVGPRHLRAATSGAERGTRHHRPVAYDHES